MSDPDTCPHCSHLWDNHDGLLTGSPACDVCGCMWQLPKPPELEPPALSQECYPYEGILDADAVYDAFWAAAAALNDDDTVHGMDHPHFDQQMDMIDTSGCGMPRQFWAHMARALAAGEHREEQP